MRLYSDAFENKERIPVQYTCSGEDVSPPLHWESVPSNTKSLLLICDDPDAPNGWTHWIVYNIPPESGGLQEALPKVPELPGGARQAVTDFGKVGYGGPCPPSGEHRYFFRLYALSEQLDVVANATLDTIVRAAHDFIIADAVLMGTYSRDQFKS